MSAKPVVLTSYGLPYMLPNETSVLNLAANSSFMAEITDKTLIDEYKKAMNNNFGNTSFSLMFEMEDGKRFILPNCWLCDPIFRQKIMRKRRRRFR